jgi:hypothetical protein
MDASQSWWRQAAEWYARDANKPLLFNASVFLWSLVIVACNLGTALIVLSTDEYRIASLFLFECGFFLALLWPTTRWMQSCARHASRVYDREERQPQQLDLGEGEI